MSKSLLLLFLTISIVYADNSPEPIKEVKADKIAHLNALKRDTLQQMTEEVIQQIAAHQKTGTKTWNYETAVMDLPVQIGCLIKRVMQLKGERYAHGLSESDLKEEISDELADIMSLVLFIAKELDIDMSTAWDKMLLGDEEKVTTRVK